MKRIILFATIVMLTISASAQVKYSRTYDKEEKIVEKKSTLKFDNLSWILRGGINFGVLCDVPESVEDEYSANTGYDLSFGFNQYFKRSTAYWGMDLGFASRGYSRSGYSSYNSYCIKFVPLTIGNKFKVNNNIKIDPHLGIFLSYDFNDEMPNQFDIGMQFGVGAWYKKFNIDLAWQQGFKGNSSHDWRYGALMLRVGVEF